MCSGAGTAEMARTLLLKTVTSSGLVPFTPDIKTVAMWELSPSCHQLIFDNHRWCLRESGQQHPTPCLFQNILDLNVPGCYKTAHSYRGKKGAIVGSWLQQAADCLAHACECPLPQGVDLGVSGLPCTDMSRAGKRKKRFGPTAPVYMTHAKFCQKTGELDMDMVQDLHGDRFDWYQLFFQPADSGFTAVNRTRTYAIGCNREYSHCLYDPFELKDSLVSKLQGALQPTEVKDFLIASPTEIQLEAQQLAARRGVQYHANMEDLTYLLSKAELRRLQEYRKAYCQRFQQDPQNDENLICFLGDNPSYSLTWSASSGRCPTFRVNSKSGLFWLPAHSRFLTSKEKLTMMGWPVHPRVAEALDVHTIPSLDVLRAAQLAGNAMHMHSVALAQMIGLMCFGPLDSSCCKV
ncbi:unnamed protein product [Effrenium voratum]|nr:unnamed protein product [Effrenium voratum]CAJ1435369.1 unnamed protein product [Effrenium voratum]